MTPVTPAERDLTIRTMLAEAGNQGASGMVAVANVIRNRVAAGRYGSGVSGVIMAKNQFEPWNPDHRGGANDPRRFKAEDEKYQEAGDLLDALNAGVLPDVTKGATHFYAPQAQADLGRDRPAWAKGAGKRIGGHVFFSPEGAVDPGAYDAMSRSKSPTDMAAPTNEFAPKPIGSPMNLAGGAGPADNPLAPKQPMGMGDSFKSWLTDSRSNKQNDPLLFRLLKSSSLFGGSPQSQPPGVPAVTASAPPSGSLTPGAAGAGNTLDPDLPAPGAANAQFMLPPGGLPAPASAPTGAGGGFEAPAAPGGLAAGASPSAPGGLNLGLLGKLFGQTQGATPQGGPMQLPGAAPAAPAPDAGGLGGLLSKIMGAI